MAKANTAPPKGTRDFLPEEVKKRDYVTGVIRRVYESHGFEPLETPSYERLETLLGKYGDEGDQLVFKILHRGQALVDGIRASASHLLDAGAIVSGRSGETAPGAEKLLADLGLRYDLTVPLARVYADNAAKLPSIFKRYQIQPVWRADSPGKARFREFQQCDVDVIGHDSPMIEAELFGAVAQCLTELGFEKFTIRLNHRRWLRSMIAASQVPDHLANEAIVAIDKLDKLSREQVISELVEKGVSPTSAGVLVQIGEGGLPTDPNGLTDEAWAAAENLHTISRLCEQTPAAGHVQFDAALARGLGYYTGAIFEIAVPGLAGSLGGGGRYDGLIGMFSPKGRDVPACGFSLGLERILVVMEERGLYPEHLQPVELVLASADDAQLEAAFAVAARLRKHGIKVDLAPKKLKPGKIRQGADQRGIRHAAWLDVDGALHAWYREEPEARDRSVDEAELLARIQGARRSIP